MCPAYNKNAKVTTRFLTIVLAALVGFSVSACSTLDVNDYCRYAPVESIREADPESLALVLGVLSFIGTFIWIMQRVA